MDQQENNDNMFINTEAVANSKETLACVRMLARGIINNGGYFTLRQSLEELSDLDLHILMSLMDTKNVIQQADLLLYFGLLSLGEGGPSLNLENSVELFNKGCMFLSGESLSRKGLVDFDLDAITFQGDLNPEWITLKDFVKNINNTPET